MTAALPPLWDPEQDDTLVCRAIRQETYDVRTFVFTAPEPRLFRFQAGQYITLTLPAGPGGVPLQRCYTLSSPPTRPEAVTITVKRVPGGPATAWLHERLQPGMSLPVHGPMGEFSADRLSPDPLAEPWLLLSGGSGITPMLSMVRGWFDRGQMPDVVFIHAARTPSDRIALLDLQRMALQEPKLRLVDIVERDAPGEAWSGARGRISLPWLSLVAPDLARRRALVCGPAPFMAAARAQLLEGGLPPERYHQESFDFAELTQAEAETVEAQAEAEAAAAAEGFSVTFSKSGRVVRCRPDQTILAAAREAGLRLPSSCTKGVCGTCKSPLLSGQVDLQHGGGIRPREIAAGLTLLCCAKPLSDCVVDR